MFGWLKRNSVSQVKAKPRQKSGHTNEKRKQKGQLLKDEEIVLARSGPWGPGKANNNFTYQQTKVVLSARKHVKIN